ncbi:MAG: hypothetical protein K9N29_08985 [Candidatus Marinimicrobia bacterium]|nr:hypothetical protein [Candidatus Neomarinimicrobiota bacterium]
MKHGNWLRLSALTFTVLVLHCCSVNPVAPNIEAAMSLENGTPLDQITWVGWNPEVTSAMVEEQTKSLARRALGFESKKIFSRMGGQVGGAKTFMNMVDVPEDAFEERSLDISVQVLHMNRFGQTAAGVEFLPSRHYDAGLIITLNWGFLDVAGDDWESLNLQPYFSEDQGQTWFPVQEYTVDSDAKTINFEIDHFTQYGWGLDEDD